jgi:hypothetical protein
MNIIKNQPPRWFWLSLAHPALSLAAFGAAWAIALFTSPFDPAWVKAMYAILHYVFLVNVTGHFLLQSAYEAPVDSSWVTYAVCVAIVLLTWLVTVLPLCWCAGNCVRWLRR